MRQDKWDRAIAEFKGHPGPETIKHIVNNIHTAFPTAQETLTGSQYGQVMSVANHSYHEGRASTGAELTDGLIMALSGEFHSIPVSVFRRITVETQQVYVWQQANVNGGLAVRGGSNDYYIQDKDGINYSRVSDYAARGLSDDGFPIYWKDYDYVSIIYFDGVEIGRQAGLL